MAKVTTLYNLKAKSHDEISTNRIGDFCLIEFNGKSYLAEYKRFLLENFSCPIQLMI